MFRIFFLILILSNSYLYASSVAIHYLMINGIIGGQVYSSDDDLSSEDLEQIKSVPLIDTSIEYINNKKKYTVTHLEINEEELRFYFNTEDTQNKFIQIFYLENFSIFSSNSITLPSRIKITFSKNDLITLKSNLKFE